MGAAAAEAGLMEAMEAAAMEEEEEVVAAAVVMVAAEQENKGSESIGHAGGQQHWWAWPQSGPSHGSTIMHCYSIFRYPHFPKQSQPLNIH